MKGYHLAETWGEAEAAAASVADKQLLFVCGAVKSGTA